MKPQIIDPSNRNVELPFIETWKTRGVQASEREVEFSLRHVKLELLCDINVR